MTKSEKREEWERAAQLQAKLPQATPEQVGELMMLAGRSHRYAEAACNYELSDAQLAREARLEGRVEALCAILGIKVKFNGDPRGYAVKLLFPSGEYNTWGGREEGWGI